MKNYGLIGNPLGHSLSQKIFNSNFNQEHFHYSLYERKDLNDLKDWIEREELQGLNVTIPYKEQIIPLLDSLSDDAREIGAVNVVKATDGRLVGFNTDAPAFAATLKPLLQPQHDHALILGTGGAAKAVAHALKTMGIAYQFVSRTPQEGAYSYNEAYIQAKHTFLIINATPLGMGQWIAKTPWLDCSMISPKHLCYDLIYNPETTRFLLECELAGAKTMNGLDMLKLQAQLAWKIWGLE